MSHDGRWEVFARTTNGRQRSFSPDAAFGSLSFFPFCSAFSASSFHFLLYELRCVPISAPMQGTNGSGTVYGIQYASDANSVRLLTGSRFLSFFGALLPLFLGIWGDE